MKLKKLWSKRKEAALKVRRFVVKPSEYNGFDFWTFPNSIPKDEIIKGLEFVVIREKNGDDFYEVFPMKTQKEGRWYDITKKENPYLQLPSMAHFDGQKLTVGILGKEVDLCLECPKKFQQFTGECRFGNHCNFTFLLDSDETYAAIKNRRTDFFNNFEKFGIGEAGFYPTGSYWEGNKFIEVKPSLTYETLSKLRKNRLIKAAKKKAANDQYKLFCAKCVKRGFHCNGCEYQRLDKDLSFKKCYLTSDVVNQTVLEMIEKDYGNIDKWLEHAACIGYEFQVEHRGEKRKSKRLAKAYAVDGGKFKLCRINVRHTIETCITLDEMKNHLDTAQQEYVKKVLSFPHEIKMNLAITSFALNQTIMKRALNWRYHNNKLVPYLYVWEYRERNSWGYHVRNQTSNYGRVLGFTMRSNGHVEAKLQSTYWSIDLDLTPDNYANLLINSLEALGYDKLNKWDYR